MYSCLYKYKHTYVHQTDFLCVQPALSRDIQNCGSSTAIPSLQSVSPDSASHTLKEHLWFETELSISGFQR